ncbi:DUF885 domain-containing protein [Flavobacterium sp. RSP15]|uniref:DUF885 domain-containing protein n=1 Tax=Flavobacterium sp. RSP15 TaxID=2497485 RepID=UPI000F816FBB|nr:DUF885 domain-containing protein [Flavobacterium sp. RSP15]RTY86264.1 DUF885 domain-containing protein [Flavobacterium sp. RSP15]
MNKLKSLLRKIAVLLFVFTGTIVMAQKNPSNAKFSKFLDNYYEGGLLLNPLTATQRGDNRYNDLFPNDIAEPYLKKQHGFTIMYQKQLASFDRNKLNSFDKISFDIVSLQIKQTLEREKFNFEYMPFSQFRGYPSSLPSLGSGKSFQPFKTAKDYENWLKRIDGFTIWADTAIANFNKGLAMKMVLPRALVIKMIPQLEAQTVTDTLKNIFYEPVRNIPSSFSVKEKKVIRLAYQNAIITKIIPTYQKLADYLKNVYLPKARTSSGYNDLPNGKAMYAYLVRMSTTTNQTPEEIYQTGLREVERITKEIENLKIKIGFQGDRTAFFNYALTDPSFFPFATDEEILESYRAILPIIEPKLKKLFNIVPKTAFEVKAIEKFKAATSAANYERGTTDGSRPGYFNVPIVDATKFNKLGMDNLFIHEAIPGHHFQLSLQQENQDLPKIRQFASYSVFSEGWALYAESLGEELGLYTDPYQKLAAYKSELFRAIRLVTDVGLHTGILTREESIQYMMEKGGREQQASVSETERYMAIPGQALSYKIGELKISELKAKYIKSLGDKFDIKKFHDAILQVGSVPLSVFETYMDNWASE